MGWDIHMVSLKSLNASENLFKLNTKSFLGNVRPGVWHSQYFKAFVLYNNVKHSISGLGLDFPNRDGVECPGEGTRLVEQRQGYSTIRKRSKEQKGKKWHIIYSYDAFCLSNLKGKSLGTWTIPVAVSDNTKQKSI